jgi:hypothetical protein
VRVRGTRKRALPGARDTSELPRCKVHPHLFIITLHTSVNMSSPSGCIHNTTHPFQNALGSTKIEHDRPDIPLHLPHFRPGLPFRRPNRATEPSGVQRLCLRIPCLLSILVSVAHDSIDSAVSILTVTSDLSACASLRACSLIFYSELTGAPLTRATRDAR